MAFLATRSKKEGKNASVRVGKKSTLLRRCAVVLVFGVGVCGVSVAHAALTFTGLMQTLTDTTNALTSVMLAAAFVGFLWTGVRYMRGVQQGATDGNQRAMQLLIGVVVLFSIFSVWGIVSFLADMILL